MSKENLQTKTCKELREQAKVLNISGRWDMTKAELVEAILRAMSAEFNNDGGAAVSAKDECKVDNQSVEAEAKCENESASVSANYELKMRYIENIELGTLVAFQLSNGKVKSAKVIRKSTKNRKLKLETDYGAEYIVSYNDIVWVRTGKRWPRGVYKRLKGIVD